MTYRGRLAPSPTGFLHRGHARTFFVAQERAAAAEGTLILRNDDLDRTRVRIEYVDAMYEDMQWLGLRWNEGPDIGGRHAPYTQSVRLSIYRAAFDRLRAAGLVYPCNCSRRDVLTAAEAPHDGEDEPIYPGTCRHVPHDDHIANGDGPATFGARSTEIDRRPSANWRFTVPLGETLRFHDGCRGEQQAVSGEDFGDFLVWRKDGLPSYQLACTVDDASMAITEVVRGEDLITSTFRQILLYRALGWTIPAFYHCPLVRDEAGRRLAKRESSTTIRGLRESGLSPAEVLGIKEASGALSSAAHAAKA